MAVSVADSDAEGLEDGTAPPDLWDYSPFDAVDVLTPIGQYEQFRNQALRLVNRKPQWVPIN